MTQIITILIIALFYIPYKIITHFIERSNEKSRLIKKYGEIDGMKIFKKEVDEYAYQKDLEKEKARDQRKIKQKQAAERKEKERKDLIKKYGKEGGLEIFSKKITEKNYIIRKDLIKKYGKEGGLEIFSKKITEKNYIIRKDLIKKYGQKYGDAIFLKKIHKGMNSSMVIDSIGKPKYKDSNKWYFGRGGFNKLIEINDDKVSSVSKCESVWIDMPYKMLISSLGKPADEKKNVTKNTIKKKLYFGSRSTRQKTTVYKLEVRLEDDVVVGFRELE